MFTITNPESPHSLHSNQFSSSLRAITLMLTSCAASMSQAQESQPVRGVIDMGTCTIRPAPAPIICIPPTGSSAGGPIGSLGATGVYQSYGAQRQISLAFENIHSDAGIGGAMQQLQFHDAGYQNYRDSHVRALPGRVENVLSQVGSARGELSHRLEAARPALAVSARETVDSTRKVAQDLRNKLALRKHLDEETVLKMKELGESLKILKVASAILVLKDPSKLNGHIFDSIDKLEGAASSFTDGVGATLNLKNEQDANVPAL